MKKFFNLLIVIVLLSSCVTSLGERIEPEKRRFVSPAVEKLIEETSVKIADEKLQKMFELCYPNTLDTTIFMRKENGKTFTHVITGDIPAMWLRDSAAQIRPYMKLMAEDPDLQLMVKGLVNSHLVSILKDPYANAFLSSDDAKTHHDTDITEMKPGVFERKWEIDSLCYSVDLLSYYYELTKDESILDEVFVEAAETIIQTFREQQRKENLGPYTFMRRGHGPLETLVNDGFGREVNPVGLICSGFRPSDDATTYLFLVPSNFFAVKALAKMSELFTVIGEQELAKECKDFSEEVAAAVQEHAIIEHPEYGKIYAYEVDGFGNYVLMDDANIPSLLALPFLDLISKDDPIYQNTRKFLLSEGNPNFYKNDWIEGIGSPHTPGKRIWPMSIIVRAFTSSDKEEIAQCLSWLKHSDAGTGFMHESFRMDNPKRYTRKWFSWANSLFGQLILEVAEEHEDVLSRQF